MSISNPIPRGTRQSPSYVADGVSATYAVPFWFLDPLDLVITVSPPGAAMITYSGAVGYTATGMGNSGGGNVTLNAVPASGSYVQITGRRVGNRLTSVVNNGAVVAAALEQELDATEATLQELRRDANLALLLASPLQLLGVWNASSNTPALVSGLGTIATFYVVGTAGGTVLDGISSWSVGDWALFDGTKWNRIPVAAATILSTQISDSTAAGRALLTAASVAAQRVALAIDQLTLVNDANQTITSAMTAVAWSAITAARVGSLPALSTLNPGQFLLVYDESGSCSSTNTITLNRAGSDTINGATSYVLNTPRAGVLLVKGTAGKWTAFPFVTQSATAQTGGVRQTVRNGPVDTNGLPTFLATSASLTLTTQNISSSNPLVVSAAAGATANGLVDYNTVFTANQSWSGLTANSTLYLYVNAQTGALGFTTLAPIYQQGGTPSTVNGQFTFNIGQMIGYMGNGTTAIATPLVFVGECTTSASAVTAVTAYAYNGYYDSGFTATLPIAVAVTKNSNIGVAGGFGTILLECTTADNGYAIGDQLNNPPSTYATMFQTRLSCGAAFYTSVIAVPNKSTGVGTSLTAASWKYKFIHRRGW
jgi:hypothetical protein